eukprot:901745-Rhodomonas_salina.1
MEQPSSANRDENTAFWECEERPLAQETEVVGNLVCPFDSKIAALASGAILDWCIEGHADIQYTDLNTTESQPRSNCLVTRELGDALDILERQISAAWPNTHLRVIGTWNAPEHGDTSLHSEGRAADIVVSGEDGSVLGRVAAMAVNAGAGWVKYVSGKCGALPHIHIS